MSKRCETKAIIELFILCHIHDPIHVSAAIQETGTTRTGGYRLFPSQACFYVKPPSSSSNARLILNNTPVFQLSSLVTWSYEYTVPVNLSKSASSHASIRSLANLASRVEGNVRSFWANSVRSLWVVTRSYIKNVQYNPGREERHGFPLTPIAIEQRAARSQYSLTEYFVRGLVKLQSATVWYSSMDFWKSPRSAESSAACW